MEKRATVGALERGLMILDMLQAEEALGVSEIGRRLGVNKSTAYRLLTTLETHGFAEQVTEGGKYRLGMKLAKFQTRVLDQFELRAAAHPFLVQLAAQTGEAAGFCVMMDNEGLLIDKADSPQNIGATLVVGMNEPLYCTSLGKALLSSFPAEERMKLLRSVTMYQRTPKTVTDLPTLLKEADQIACSGYTVDDEQYCEGMRCIAAPVFDFTGKAVASIGISAPIQRLTASKTKESIAILLQIAADLSRRLGA